MAIAAVETSRDYTAKNEIVYGTLTFSGSYATGGDTLNFDAISKASRQSPIFVEIHETGVPSGYSYSYVASSDEGTGKVAVLETGAAVSTPQTQIAAAAYPAAITGATVIFKATFPRL
jgi:hypothetical protein